MKKIISIPLILLILFSGINVIVATHFCGGNFSGTKISLNGELASCGMEDQSETSSQQKISNHCCENIVTSYSISSKYIPSFCTCITDHVQNISQMFLLFNEPLIKQEVSFYAISGNSRPPGVFCPADVRQQVICIFQI